MLALLTHLFIPHPSNNHKAKALHNHFLLLFILIFGILQFSISFAPYLTPSVFGYHANITPEKIIELTNIKRKENGAGEVTLDTELSKGAQTKAADMFARNYWAHNSPDGKEPWHFFIESGYQYKYAGENLARDFTNPEDVVEAWMASPTHKENMLSGRYKDIGIAVVEGELKGVKTTLVVQHFGTKLDDSTLITLNTAPPQTSTTPSTQVGGSTIVKNSPPTLTSPFLLAKNIGMVLTGIFVLLLILDIIIVRQSKVMRSSSNSGAHLTFMVVVLLIILIAKSGLVL